MDDQVKSLWGLRTGANVNLGYELIHANRVFLVVLC